VLSEAEQAARGGPPVDLPVVDLPFVTLDPTGAHDLDQAFHLARRRGGGFTVSYAIADLGSWVAPDGAVAAEAWRRVLTVYCPDRRVPLHPRVLSEQAASLWPDAERPAVRWTIDVDADGQTRGVDVRRALVRSHATLDYAGVQAALDAGTAEPMLDLLPEVGSLLAEAQLERGGSNLPLPDRRWWRPTPATAWSTAARCRSRTGTHSCRC
jgi:exoribonuclease R